MSYTPESRKQADRKKVPGTYCSLCKEYYSSFNLSSSDLKKKLDGVSRHREYPRPPTPEHYWELDFPSDAECIKRGYMEAEPQPYSFKPLKSNKYQTHHEVPNGQTNFSVE